MKIHQIISIIIIGLCLSVFFIQTIIYKKLSADNIIHSFIYYGIMQFFFIFGDFWSEKYLDNYEESPFLFIFKIGIIGLMIIIIYSIIISIINRQSALLELINICFSGKYYFII